MSSVYPMVSMGASDVTLSNIVAGVWRMTEWRQDVSARVRIVLEDLGRRHGVSAATIVYAWILRHPSRPLPITGSSRPEALREAVGALDVRLSAEDWYRVWQASTGHEVA